MLCPRNAVALTLTYALLRTEYMHHGSLYELIHNETMVLEGDMIVHILQDISKGVRFLHTADPQVIREC